MSCFAPYRPACRRPQSFFIKRSFFSLPGQAGPGVSSSKDGITQYHERKVLPYLQEQLYAIVADVDEYNTFIPLCTESRVLAARPAGLTGRPWLTSDAGHRLRAELKIAFLGLSEAYTSEVECQRPSLVKATATPSRLLRHLTTTWAFSPAPTHPGATDRPNEEESESQTMVSFDLAYAFADPLQQAIAGAAFERISSKIMGAFEKRCFELYGQKRV